MKVRLVTRRSDPARVVHALFPGEPVLEGYELIFPETPPTFKDMTMEESMAKAKAEMDLCRCNDERRSHMEHKGRCMVRRHGKVCGCLHFQEKGS